MPRVSVIIPTFSAERSGNLARLLEDLDGQTLRPAEVECVHGVAPNGRARNVGAARTSGDVLVFLDDDVRLGSRDVLERMAAALETPEHGMVGTAQLLPPDSTPFQLKLARQLPRSSSSLVTAPTESDMVTTQCCAVRRTDFERVQGFHEGLLRGVDPEFRERIRRIGLKVVVVPHIWHYHPAPATWRNLLRMAFRDGYSSAQVFQDFPSAVLYNPEGHVAEFEARRSPLTRYLGRFSRLVSQVAKFEVYGAAYSLSYILGYLWAFIRRPRRRA